MDFTDTQDTLTTIHVLDPSPELINEIGKLLQLKGENLQGVVYLYSFNEASLKLEVESFERIPFRKLEISGQ